jgi:hypothetical protein
MPVNKETVITIPISEKMDLIATYLAEKRMLFEYPRQGYGNYNTRGIDNIKAGILGELAFLEYAIQWIEEKFGSYKAEERWRKLKDIGFCYLNIVGVFDDGFEFKLGNKTVDIKNYGTRKISKDQIFEYKFKSGRVGPLNLLIDANQSSKADIYIQVFQGNENDIYLAGFCDKLPPVNYGFPQPAHQCPITDLNPMKDIFIYLNG